MSPALTDAPLSMSLQRLVDNRGEGLFTSMLEALDPDEEAERLLASGLNVLPLMAGAGGYDIHAWSVEGPLTTQSSHPRPLKKPDQVNRLEKLSICTTLKR